MEFALNHVFRGTGFSTADTEGYSEYFAPFSRKSLSRCLLKVADEDQMGEDFVRTTPMTYDSSTE